MQAVAALHTDVWVSRLLTDPCGYCSATSKYYCCTTTGASGLVVSHTLAAPTLCACACAISTVLAFTLCLYTLPPSLHFFE
jgi:hypothetical protein